MSPRRRLRSGAAVAATLLLATVAVVPPSATASTSGTVFVQTVPALAGVRLSVGATVVTTGSDGSASVQVGDLSAIASTVALADDHLDDATALAIRKVVTEPHAAAHESHLSIGLDTTSLVRLKVVSGRTGVAAGEVRLVRLHSVTGQVMTLDPTVTPVVQLLSRHTRLSHGVLTPQRVTWSVDRISAGPGVALTTATPRFDPLQSSTWQLELQPVKGTVRIATVPATAGVTFLLEGATVTTGRDGTATAPIGDLNRVDRRLRLDTPDAGPLSVALVRVSKLKPGAVRQRRLLAGLAVHRPVTLHFVDPAGHPVDSARISEVRLEGGGSVIRLDSNEINQPVTLLAGVATQVDKVWRARQFSYAVSSVKLEGSDAVFAGRQRFNPNTSAAWPVTLSVFELTVTVHDVLFGSRVSSRVWITRPDGTTYPVHVSAGKATVVPSMVRGLYDLKVGSAAVGAHTKVLVSRDDKVDVRVVTVLDAVLIVLGTVALAVAAVLTGALIARERRRTATTKAT